MIKEQANLFYKDIRSDKVYHIQLSESESGWEVTAQWGRRGSTLQSDIKVSGGSYDDAKKVFDKVVHEKTGKGYQPIPGTKQPAGTGELLKASAERVTPKAPAPKKAPASVGEDGPLTRSAKPVSKQVVFSCELLTRVDQPTFMAMAKNDRYLFQPKRDCIRLTTMYQDGELFGLNKLGQVVQIDQRLYTLLMQFVKQNRVKSFVMDGELEPGGYFVWDLLDLNKDLRSAPYERRLEELELLEDRLPGIVHVIETARDTKAKLKLAQRLLEDSAEGVCVKDRHAPFRPGRNGQHYKMKYEMTASVIVGPKERPNDGHRSVGMWLLEPHGTGLKKRYMGSVGVPDKYELPKEGQIIEVRYLYCHNGVGGRLVQAKYFGVVRKDVRREDCTPAQLRVKADPDAA